jgi:hypothetical protein
VVCINKETTRDFTLDKYRELCHTLQTSGYTPLTVRDYLNGKSSDSPTNGAKIVILRHDVDRKIMNALRMAKLEYEMRIQSTYFFRYPYTFKTNIIREIQGLGHEIGYHYEVLGKTNGDYQKAITLFKSELGEFRKVCPIDTICAHGQPLLPLDNGDLWKQYDFQTYDIKGEADLSILDADYFSDTGRNWKRRNIRSDFLGADWSFGQTETTNDMIEVIQRKESRVLYLSAHPERWSHSSGSHLVNYCTDLIFNVGKIIIKGIRR